MRHIIIIVALIFLISGCATTPSQTVATAPLQKPYSKGVYHTILKGQTLWRIAKAYRTDIGDIIKANSISDPSKIDAGQMIFIPGAKTPIRERLALPAEKISKKGYVWPVKGKMVSYFGSNRDNAKSKGIDIEAEDGQTIIAARSGKVVFCDEKVKGLGRTIIIEHDDGYSTLYAHNSVNLVTCGDVVKQNQPIARVGTTGRVDRPTLHFQIRKGHEPQNPFYYLS